MIDAIIGGLITGIPAIIAFLTRSARTEQRVEHLEKRTDRTIHNCETKHDKCRAERRDIEKKIFEKLDALATSTATTAAYVNDLRNGREKP